MTRESPGVIRRLPKLLVDQIAAGEVVERPASVVRELVDNAIDAGARSIELTLEGGGRTLVRVSDDGAGIDPVDLPLAFASHATSKLATLEDLTRIATLGFRGEALASIGAVSRARIRSRARGGPHACEIDCEGGRISAVRPAARAPGTDVEVRDLFFELPARRRFLKRDATEAAHAVDVLVRQALAHPEVDFRAFVDGATSLDLRGRAEDPSEREAARVRRERIAACFGAEAAESLTEVRAEGAGIALAGFAGPGSNESGAAPLHLFVNTRWIQDRGAVRVVRDALFDFFGSRAPLVFLFVSLDPSLLDVNVHPAKLEVRFREPGLVYGTIHRALRGAFEGSRALAGPQSLLREAPRAEALDAAILDRAPAIEVPPARGTAPLFEGTFRETLLPRASRYLRAFSTFLVVESEEGLDLVDQHALHERVNYEDLRARVRSGSASSQRLLVPETLELTRGDAALAEECAETWARVGLEVGSIGPSAIAIRGVPAGLRRLAAGDLVRDLLELARRGGAPGADRMLEDVLHRCACHASVKAGDALSDEEIESLLAKASSLPADQTCPHGRPTRIRLTRRDLERAFERS